MSLITRCPACGTMFKVVPDQLRISEGWVRCGHCAEVFDATLHLHGEDALAGATPAVQPAQQPAPPAAKAASEPEAFASSLHTEVGDEAFGPEDDSALLEAAAQSLVEHPLDRPFELRREDAGQDARPARPAESQQPEASPPEPELDDLSFVRQAQRKAFWRRPAMRAALVAAVIALAVSFTLQVAVQGRDRLAAAQPGLRPWLARLCEPFRCTIRAPRQIEAIAIDNSSFSKLRPDAYRLNVTLKNQAPVEVAMPALELTLTDGQDQAVVRRVLMPAELATGAAVIPAASEWSSSLGLVVAANGTANRIAGYRLLAFYP
jgi:predicted Zn finger-like uncharacterized protein